MCVLFSTLYRNKGPLNCTVSLNRCQHTRTPCVSKGELLPAATNPAVVDSSTENHAVQPLATSLACIWPGDHQLFSHPFHQHQPGVARAATETCRVCAVWFLSQEPLETLLDYTADGGVGGGGWYLDPPFKDRMISPAECHCHGEGRAHEWFGSDLGSVKVKFLQCCVHRRQQQSLWMGAWT